MIAEFNAVVGNRIGNPLYCTVTPSGSMARTDVVIFVHGFKGFRNWGFFPFASQYFARQGYHVIRFDMSLNGMEGTNDSVQNLQHFASNTISTEVDDVHDLVGALDDHEAFESIRHLRSNFIHFIGHSRGGGVALLAAAELLDQRVKVRSVTGWNSVGRWGRYSERQKADWIAKGFIEFENSRTKQILRMDKQYVEDLEANADRLDLVSASRKVGKKLHFIHAETDLTVPNAEIKKLISTSKSNARYTEIEGSTHTFGITHPIEHITQAFVNVLKHSNRHIQS